MDLSDIFGAAKGTADTIGQAQSETQNDAGQVGGTTSQAGKVSEDIATSLGENRPQVQQAIQNIGQQTQQTLTPAGQTGIDSANKNININQVQQQEAFRQWQGAVNSTNTAYQDFENSIQDATQAAKVDPQHYNKALGLSGKTVTALGMLVSGIGAGLTGQPNAAVEQYNTNVQRDIEAQKQNFFNLMQEVHIRSGEVQNAQMQQSLMQQAGAASELAIRNGISSLLDSSQAKLQGTTGQDKATILKQQNDQALAKTLLDQAQLYKTQVQSGDTKHINGLGMGASAVTDWVRDKAGLPPSRFSLSGKSPQQRLGLSPDNSTQQQTPSIKENSAQPEQQSPFQIPLFKKAGL